MRSYMLSVFLSLMTVCTFGETFFVCTDEKCDGEIVALDEQVREGIFDGLFEAGHIVFDDCIIKRDKEITNDASIRDLIGLAREEGAPFLVVVRVNSTKKVLSPGVERIQSNAEYLLYDVAAGTRMGRGELGADNLNKESEMKRGKLWFSLGQEISDKISALFNSSRKAAKKAVSGELSQVIIKEQTGHGK